MRKMPIWNFLLATLWISATVLASNQQFILNTKMIEHEFKFKPTLKISNQIERVFLSGSFNQWIPAEMRRSEDDVEFSLKTSFPKVEYHRRFEYKYRTLLKNGETVWLLDEQQAMTQDPLGNWNNVLILYNPENSVLDETKEAVEEYPGVYVDEERLLFTLQTLNASYAFRVRGGVLEHLYWGSRISARDDLSYLSFDSRIVSFDAGIKNSISTEYAGDFRIPSFQLEYADGSTVSPFTYDSFSVSHNATVFREHIPHFRADKVPSTTLIIKLIDTLKKTEMFLYYTLFKNHNVITRATKLRNPPSNQQAVLIKHLSSVTIDFPASSVHQGYYMTHFSGSWARERHPMTKRLDMGLSGIESRRGLSSHQHNPFVLVSESTPEENHGECFGIGLVYASNFQIMTEVTQTYSMRVVAGMHPDTFEWLLRPGKSFLSPESVLVYSGQGASSLSNDIHRLIQNALMPHVAHENEWIPDKPRPVLVNSWEAMYFNCSEQAIIDRLGVPGKQLGIDMVVLDDGWFVGRHNDSAALGDWVVDREKFPGGLKQLSTKLNDLGLSLGLWLEPEMVSRASHLYEQHPDYALHSPNRTRTESRHQLVLDLSREDVRQHIISRVVSVLEGSGVQYVKWDFNRPLSEVENSIVVQTMNAQGPEDEISRPFGSGWKRGELLHRWTLGLYKVWFTIVRRFPNILFESCAGGGGRFDLALLYFSSQVWTSDNTDAVARLPIQIGTSFLYPPLTQGTHVSATPNHQLHRTTPLKSRHIMALFGTFGYEMALDTVLENDSDSNVIRTAIRIYKQLMQPLLIHGTFHRLTPLFPSSTGSSYPSSTTETGMSVYAWMQLREQREAMVGVMTVGYISVVQRTARVKLVHLHPDTQYRVREWLPEITQDQGMDADGWRTVGVWSGSMLMRAGLLVTSFQDAMAFLFHIEALSQ